jgi:uncharacterized protein (TIGR03435 family)
MKLPPKQMPTPKMRRAILTIGSLIFTGIAVNAQATPSFEVAVIRPAEPPGPNRRMMFGMSGGPGSKDPTRVNSESVSMSELLMRAYDVKRYQITGPAWMDTERFSISAKVPEGATKEQFLLMLQNLLAERFKMVVHREQKEMPVLELQIAKGGSKMKDTTNAPPPDVPEAPPPGSGPIRMRMDAEGYPVPPPGRTVMMFMNGRGRYQAVQQPIDNLVSMISNQLGKPVIDATGLKGKYDFTLSFAMTLGMAPAGAMIGPPPPPGGGGGGGGGPEPAGGGPDVDSGPALPGALQQQLGLKLESKKGMVDIVVVDRAEKVPTEN